MAIHSLTMADYFLSKQQFSLTIDDRRLTTADSRLTTAGFLASAADCGLTTPLHTPAKAARSPATGVCSAPTADGGVSVTLYGMTKHGRGADWFRFRLSVGRDLPTETKTAAAA